MDSPYINVDRCSTSGGSSPECETLIKEEALSPAFQDIKSSNYDIMTDGHIYAELPPYGDVKYSSYYNLMPVDSYRTASSSPTLQEPSTLLYPMLAWNDQLLSSQPLPIQPVERDYDEAEEHYVDDYGNLASITPTLFTVRPPDDYRSTVSYSPRHNSSSSSTSSSSYAPSSAWIPQEESSSVFSRNSPTNNITIAETLKKECVNCGEIGSEDYWPDGTGHFLCHKCRQLIHRANAPRPRSKPKTSKRCGMKKNENNTCSNCSTDCTALWRRNHNGDIVCNACGLYFKLHKCNRPLSMRKDTIQKRKRKPKSPENRRRLNQTIEQPYSPPTRPEHIHDVSASPPSYESHLVNSGTGVLPIAGHDQPLPAVHSSEGFLNLTVPYVNQSAYSPGYPSPTDSPIITSLLQSGHRFQSPFNEGFQHFVATPVIDN